MKTPLVRKEYIFHRFNENTNTIDFDHRTHITRHMTPAEATQYCRLRRLLFLSSTLTVLCLLTGLGLMICAAGGILPDWWAGIGLVCSIGLICIPLRFVLQFTDDKNCLLNKELPQVGFEGKDADYQKMEDETKAYAERWRAAHPLEEKIRIAQQSGNCVDIAELVRYCGADLVDKLK